MYMLSTTSRTGLAHVHYLTVKARPEHTIMSLAEGKLRTPICDMEFKQEAFSKRGCYDDAILLGK